MADLSYKVTVDTAGAERSLQGLQTAITALGAALVSREFIRFADSITQLQNKLSTLNPALNTAEEQFKALAAIAISARTPLEQTGELYFRIARASEELGISNRESAQITETLAKALSASGISAGEAAGPLLQLGQALQSGRFQGDELRSILEGMPVVARALATELNVPIGALRDLGSQGKITADVFVRAMRNARDAVDEAFGRTQPTISQAFNNLKTNAALAFNEFEKNTQTGRTVAATLEYIGFTIFKLSKNIDEIIGPLGTFIKIIGAVAAFTVFNRVLAAVGAAFAGIAGAVRVAVNGFSSIGKTIEITIWQFKKIISAGEITGATIAGLAKRFSFLAEGVMFLVRGLGSLAAGVAAFLGLDKAIEWFKSLGDANSQAGKELQDYRKELDKYKDSLSTVEGPNRAAAYDQEQLGRKVAGVVAQLQQAARAWYDQATALETNLKIQNQVIDATDEQRRLVETLAGLETSYFQEARRLQDELARLKRSTNREDLAAIPEVERQIKKLDRAYANHVITMRDLVIAQTELQNKRQLYLYGVSEEQRQQDALLRIQREVARTGMSEIEKKYEDIRDAADDAARAAIRAEQARRMEPLSTAEIEEYYRIARQGQERLIDLTRKGFEQSRTWSAGWRQAYREYADNATNAARRAQSIFQKTMQGMEDLLVDFVKTGKFEWKNFVSMMLEELLRAQIQQTFAQIFNPNTAMGQKGGFLDGIIGTIGSLFGAGGSQRGSSPGTPLYVMDISAGYGAGGYGSPMTGQQGGTGIMGILGSVGKTIGNVIGGVTGGIGKVIGGVVDTVGSIGKAIGGSGIGQAIGSVIDWGKNLFSGFFANGGMIPAGRFGIVGERGPEYVGGPAQVTPMPAQQVVYNINAVDAASFRQLVARDPGFIHAVAQQGARSVPQARS